MEHLVELAKQLGFAAAHRLPTLPPTHARARLHGHSYRVEVMVRGPVDARLGWVIDFAEITAAARPIVDALDHRCLNEIEGLSNPTSENLARWIWHRLAPQLPLLFAVTISATCTPRCTYRGDNP